MPGDSSVPANRDPHITVLAPSASALAMCPARSTRNGTQRQRRGDVPCAQHAQRNSAPAPWPLGDVPCAQHAQQNLRAAPPGARAPPLHPPTPLCCRVLRQRCLRAANGMPLASLVTASAMRPEETPGSTTAGSRVGISWNFLTYSIAFSLSFQFLITSFFRGRNSRCPDRPCHRITAGVRQWL